MFQLMRISRFVDKPAFGQSDHLRMRPDGTGIVIRVLCHNRQFVEVEGGRRRWGLFPLKALRAPRILWRTGTSHPRPAKIEDWDHVADPENRCACTRED